jgi:hypothetical protein
MTVNAIDAMSEGMGDLAVDTSDSVQLQDPAVTLTGNMIDMMT